MRLTPRTSIGLLLACTLLLGDRCPDDDDGEQAPGNLSGSVWSYTVQHALAYRPGEHAEPLANDGPSLIRHSGRFRVSATAQDPSAVSLQIFPLESLESTAFLKYIHRAEGTITTTGYHCSGSEGVFPLSAGSTFGGDYLFIPAEETRAMLGETTPMLFDDGKGEYPIHSFQLGPHVVSGKTGFSYTCTYEDGNTSTHAALALDPTAPYYGVPARDGTFSRVFQNSNWTEVSTVTLSCQSGCSGDDECDAEEIFEKCDALKDTLVEFCQTLDGWMVVLEKSDVESPEVVCGDPDCSDVIQANQERGGDPWHAITEHWSASCGDRAGDVACSVECYGWLETE